MLLNLNFILKPGPFGQKCHFPILTNLPYIENTFETISRAPCMDIKNYLSLSGHFIMYVPFRQCQSVTHEAIFVP